MILFLVQVLEDEKLHHMVTIGEYPLYIVPMDEDVLSFELDLSYKVCFELLISVYNLLALEFLALNIFFD